MMIVFVDTEVSLQDGRACDYGAVREDGAVLHTRSREEYLAFAAPCDVVCGHNIIGFDLKHTPIDGNHIFVDTLYLHTRPRLPQTNIAVSLGLHDVWLDYFRDRKDSVLRLRSGDPLRYSKGYLLSEHGEYIASLSKNKRQQIDALQAKGHSVASAEVSYVLAWRPREEPQEVAVCLANLILEYNQSNK